MRVPSRATFRLGHAREPTPEYRSQAYWCGWIDGRFGETECFTENLNLVRYSALPDRLDYYRGHRAGSEARFAASNGRLPVGAVRETREMEGEQRDQR